MLSGRVFIFCLFVFTFVSKSETEEIQPEEAAPDVNILEFEVCPKSHPYEREEGKVCCSGQPSSEEGCGEAVNCTASRCEDVHTFCYENLFGYENLSPEYDKTYSEVDNILEANRPIFQREGKCIWWHQPSRHWWIGPCENVGTDSGYAYIDDDVKCPGSSNWKRSGSHELIPNIQFFKTLVQEQSEGYKSDDQSGTAAISVIVSNGRYQQKCRFKYINGNYKCTNQ